MADLESLPSSFLLEFEGNENWTKSRTKNRCSAIVINHAHEQNNKLVKGVGGIIGITEDPSSLAQWILIGPTLARLVDDYQENDHDTDELRPHQEECKFSQLRFLRHDQNMSDSIFQVGNPFQEEEKELVSLHGRVQQIEDYKEAVLENRTRNLQTPIKNRSSNVKHQPRKKTYLTSRIIRRCMVIAHTSRAHKPLL